MTTGTGREGPGVGATGAGGVWATTSGWDGVLTSGDVGLPAGSGDIPAAIVGAGALSTVDALRARAFFRRGAALLEGPGPSESEELGLARSFDMPRGR